MPIVEEYGYQYGGKYQMTTQEQITPERVSRDIEAAGVAMREIRSQIGRVIFGQGRVIEETLVTLLAGGHLLLIGVPGLAKTKLVETVGLVMGLTTRRIQCTPDLMPSDIVGSEILDEDGEGRRSFRFVQGPVFAQMLMADEINRASPRTQSALLQAMQERHVTIAGTTYALPHPFHVLATQNPLEQEGTYPLPEAQLDRFLMQVDVNYPDREAERTMLAATTGQAEAKPLAVLDGGTLARYQELVRMLPVGERVVDAILTLVRSARPADSPLSDVRKYVSWGPGPRASQSLMLACRARALLDGRLSPSIDDVAALADPVLKHRMALGFAARAEGITIGSIVQRLVSGLG